MASGGQRQVRRSSWQQGRLVEMDGGGEMEGEDVSEEEQEETKEALYGYIFRRAEGDSNLSRVETASFEEAKILRTSSGALALSSSPLTPLSLPSPSSLPPFPSSLPPFPSV